MSTIMLSADWRVRPLDHLQWVLEHRRPRSQLKGGGERWDAWAYCRTRVGLETALSRLRCEGIVFDPAPLAGLPDNFDSTPAMPRRALLVSRIVEPSGAEIIAGVRAAIAAGIPPAAIAQLLQERRSATVRRLAFVGLNDAGSAADPQRLERRAP